jgi:hypothetical protein
MGVLITQNLLNRAQRYEGLQRRSFEPGWMKPAKS